MNVQKRRSVDGGPGKPKSTLAAMQDIEKKRQERRQQMEERKVRRARRDPRRGCRRRGCPTRTWAVSGVLARARARWRVNSTPLCYCFTAGWSR